MACGLLAGLSLLLLLATASLADVGVGSNGEQLAQDGGPGLRDSALQVDVTAPASPVEICGTALFTATIHNLGPDPAYTVTLTSAMPSGFTGSPQVASTEVITVGETVTYTFLFTAACAAIAGDNTMTVTHEGGSDIVRSTAYTVNPGALVLQQRAVAVNGAPIAPTTSPSARVGDTVTWRITITSSGLGPIENVVAQNAPGAGLSYVSSSPAGSVVGDVVSWSSAEAPALARLEAGQAATLEVISLVEACANLDSTTTATWGCDAEDCLAPDEQETTSVSLLVKEPLLAYTPANVSLSYCTSLVTSTFPIQNTGEGAAHDVFLEVDLTGYTVTALSAGASYVTSPKRGFDLPDIPGGGSYTLTYTLQYTGDWCQGAPPTGTRYWYPTYENDCVVVFYTPVRANNLAVTGGPASLSLSKDGPVVAALGDTVQYTITAALNDGDTCASGSPSSITITDTFPSSWTVQDADGGTVQSNRIVWVVPASGATLQPSFNIPDASSGGCASCGGSATNQVTASATDCCGCLRTAAASVTTAVECPDTGVGLGSTRTTSSTSGYEYCTPVEYTTTYTFDSNSRWDSADWSLMLFREDLPAGQAYRSGTLQVTINGNDYTSQVTLQATGDDLVVDFADASIPEIVASSTMVIDYQLDTAPTGCGASTSWQDFATLEIDVTGLSGFEGACGVSGNTLYTRDAVAVTLYGSRMSVAVAGIPDIVGSCGAYTVTVTLSRDSSMPVYDALLFLDTTNYEVITVTAQSGVAPSAPISGTAVTGGYQWNYGDLFAGANVTSTLTLYVQARCLSSATLPATAYYNNNCGDLGSPSFPMDTSSPDRSCTSSASDQGQALSPVLSITKFPEQKLASGTQVTWRVHLVNSGAGSAYSVQLVDLMGPSQAYASATWNDASGVITMPNQDPDGAPMNGVTFLIDELTPGEFRDVDIVADLAGCDNDTNQITLQTACLEEVCAGPVSDTSILQFPPANLVATSQALTPVNPCTTTDVILTVRNAGQAPIYDVELNLTLPAGLSYVVGSSRYQVNGGGYIGAGVSEPQSASSPLIWSYTQSNSNLFGYLDELPPNTTVNVRLSVDVSCAFAQSSLQFYASYKECNAPGRAQTATNTYTVRPNRPVITISKLQTPTGRIDCGASVTWTIRITNALLGTDNQPVTATLVAITDTLGAAFAYAELTESGSPVAGAVVNGQEVRWEAANLAPGQTRTFALRATLNGAPCSSSLTNNLAAVWGCGATDEDASTAPTCLGVQSSTSASVTRAQPTLTTAFTGTLTSCSTGNQITITVTNTDTVATASSTAVTITLPSGVTYVPGSANPAPSASSTSVITYLPGALGDIGPGSVVTITLQADVACAASGNVTLSGSYRDCCNSSVALSRTHTPTWLAPTLVLSKTITRQTIAPGGAITWTIRVTNTSATTAAGYALVEDTLGLAYSSPSASGTALVVGRSITWELASLAPGASRVMTLTATVQGGYCASDDRRNRVRATWGCDQDGNVDENPATTADRNCASGLYTSYSDAWATMPDLSFAVSPSVLCNLDGSITVSATVRNHNLESATALNVQVRISVTGATPVTLTTTPANIAPNDTGVVSYTTPILSTGVVRTADLTIDPLNAIGECNETNNLASGSATCQVTMTLLKDVTGIYRAEQWITSDHTEPGDLVRYRLRATNTGVSAAYHVNLSDTVPVGAALFAYQPGSTEARWPLLGASAYTTDPTGADVLEWGTDATLGVNETLMLSYTLKVHAIVDGGVYTNTASVAAQDGSGQVVAGDTDDETRTGATPGLITDKTIPALIRQGDVLTQPTTVWPGDVITYQLVMTNVGLGDVYDVVVRDVLPQDAFVYQPGSASIVWPSGSSSNDPVVNGRELIWATGADLIGGSPMGQALTVTFRAVLTDSLIVDGETYTNTLTVTAQDGDGQPVPAASGLGDDTDPDDSDDASLVGGRPKLVATKVDALYQDADASSSPSPGDTLLYTVRITNTGSADATGVTLRDLTPAHTSYVPGSASASPGSTVASQNPLQVNYGVVAPNGIVTATFRVQVEKPLAAGITQIANQGIIECTESPALDTDDPDQPGDDDPTTTPVVAAPILQASKMDALALDADESGGFSPGDRIRYTIDIYNAGNQNATAVVFSDPIPANTTLVGGSVQTSLGTVDSEDPITVTIGTLVGSQHATVTFTVQVDDPLLPGVTQVSNQGVVHSTELPDVPTDDPDLPGADQPTDTPLTATPDVYAFKSDMLYQDADHSGAPSPGDVLLYQITVINNGNQDASDVVFTDAIPPHTTYVPDSAATDQGSVTSESPITVEIGTLAGQGGVAHISYKVAIVNPLPVDVFAVENQGLVTCCDGVLTPTDDPDTTAEDDETVTPVTADPMLGATKRDSLLADTNGDGAPSPGETIVYQIVVRNTGNRNASGVVLEDTIPQYTQLVAGSIRTDVGAVLSQNPVRVNIGTLAGQGGAAHIEFRVVVDSPLPAGVNRVANQGMVRSDQTSDTPTDDPDTLQDDDDTETPVTVAPHLEASKEAFLVVDADGDGAPSPGDTLGYRITLRNTGNAGMSGVVVTDLVPQYTTFVPGSASATSGVVESEAPLRVNVGVLPGAGGEATISFQVVIDEGIPPTVSQIENQAIVSSNELGDLPTDDPEEPGDDDPTDVLLASMALHPMIDWHDPHCAGWKQRYTISFTNDGGASLTHVRVADTIPEVCDVVLADCTVGAVYDGDRTVTWLLDAVAPGQTVVLYLEIRPWSSLAVGTIITNCVAVSSDQLAAESSCVESTIVRCDDVTPTPAVTKTATPTGTPTPTVGPSPTLTLTPTPGAPGKLYLPSIYH